METWECLCFIYWLLKHCVGSFMDRSFQFQNGDVIDFYISELATFLLSSTDGVYLCSASHMGESS